MQCLRAIRFFPLFLGLLIIQFSVTVHGANREKPAKPERPSKYKLEINVPEIIQKDLIERKVKFAVKIYPGVDAELLQRDFEEYLRAGNCDVRVYKASGAFLIISEGSQRVGSGCSLTAWDYDGVFAKEPPAGVELKQGDDLLTLDEAVKIATSVLVRLVPDPKTRASLTMTTSGEAEHIEHYTILWEEKTAKPYETRGKRIWVTVRKKDGLVLAASVTQPLEEPKISFEQIVEMARKEIEGFRAKNLRLRAKYHFVDRRLVWEYAYVSRSEGYVGDLTRWDAMTGELLYSEASHRRKDGKPYMNPNFYSYPTEEQVKAMVEKLIQKRAQELE